MQLLETEWILHPTFQQVRKYNKMNSIMNPVTLSYGQCLFRLDSSHCLQFGLGNRSAITTTI